MTIDGAFDDAVRRFPQRLAVKSAAGAATYSDLDRYARRLSAWLRAQGVDSGHNVAIFLPRSVELVALMIAVARLGAVSAPLDSSMPLKRRDSVMRQLDAVLTVEAADRGDVGRIMRDPRSPFAQVSEIAHQPHDLAMIFFTSGSTGVPKGVAVPHVGITLLMREPDFVPVTPDTRIAHLANPAFDALSFDLWAALLNGACVVIFEEDEVLDPELFARRATADLCDTAFLTTSLFKLLTEYAPQVLARMKHLLVGGEAFEPASACRLYDRCADATVQLYNAYGPTEFATFSLVHRMDRERLADYVRAGRVPIGLPVRGTTPIIVADGGSVAAPGEIGELFLAGPRIARGYVGNGEETASRFVELDVGTGTCVLAYATGDRVRLNENGLIEFLGRLDDQVKVRGHRIELDDVLNAIVAQPEVVDAAVLPRRAPDGTVALHAFVQLRDGATADGVRIGVCERLPPYMIPAMFHCLERIPLNRNGKADRRRLEAFLESAPGPANVESADAEALFVNAYRQVLGREPDLSRSFAEGGGHSLAAVRIAAAVGKGLGIPLRFTDFVQRMPLRELLAELVHRPEDMVPLAMASDEQDAADCYPAASEQERLYFLRRLAPDSDAYNAVFRFDVPRLDEERLRTALAAVQARNPLLSARFVLRDRLMVELSPGAPVDFAILDPGAGSERAARRSCFEPFDPGQAGAWRIVYEKGFHRDVLWIALDHLVVDSWSLGILLEDLSQAYAAAPDPSQEHPRYGHAAYCRYRKAEARTEAYAAQRQAWKEILARRVPASLTIGGGDRRYPRPGRIRRGRMTAEGWARLQRHGLDGGHTVFASLMSAWVTAACAALGRDRLAVGFPVSRRIHEDHAACVGLFAETLVGDFDACGEDGFDRHLARVSAEIESVFSRYQTSFADIVAAAPRGGGGAALFDSMLVLEDLGLGRLVLGGQACRGVVERGRDVKFPLTLFVTPDSDGAEIVIEHDPEIVSDEQAGQMLVALHDPPSTGGPGSPSSGRDDLDRLLLDFGRHDPSSIAVAEGGTLLSYGDLEARVRACADAVSAVAWREARVGILMEVSTSALVGLLGILRSGRAYVPLDPALPPARLKAMIADSEVRFAFCDVRHRAVANSLGLAVLDEEPATKGGPGQPTAPARVDAASPAYVLFTSGSTGRPKGVEVTRRGIANYLKFAARTYYASNRTGIVSSPLSFDATLTTLLAPLAAGGTVRLLPPGPAAVPELATAIAQGEAAVFKVTPSHLAALSGYLARHAPVATPHVFVIGGEALGRATAGAFAQACPNARLINEYGPTETVVGCTFHEVQDEPDEDVPIGMPIDGMTVEVVTDELDPVAPGAVGELLIKGPGVARGYVGRADLTAEKFVRAGKGLAYRSGDLGRIDAQGRLRYVGRRDDQVKIRGHRVELGEIEAALAACPTVSTSAVLLVEAAEGRDPYLAAFVAPLEGRSEAELRALLKESLPAHMLPARISRLAVLPLTRNDKIDRQELRRILTPSTSRVSKAESKMNIAQLNASDWLTNSLTEMLGRPVKPDENFFDAGANSLILMRLHADLTHSFAPDAQLADFFSFPTIRALSERLGDGKPVPEPLPSPTPSPTPPRIEDGPRPEPAIAMPDAGLWLAEAVERLAGREVGEDENFFDAGLSSLALMRLHAEAIAGPYPELGLSELFDNPTVALLTRHLAEAHGRPAAMAGAPDTLVADGGGGTAAPPDADVEHIAIIGMAVDLPGAPDLAAFWTVVESGLDCIKRVGDPRPTPNGTFVPAVSMLADPLGFDAAWFGLPAQEARLMDPQQRVLLMVAASALANAGIEPTRTRRKSIGVAVSASENSYLRRIWEAEQAGEKIDPFMVSLLNEKDMLSSRLAYHFNLSGPALTVQTACSSSLTAIHLACDQLRAGTCDLFVAGGVCIDLSKADGYLAPRDSIYSADGYCRAFSDEAGGTVPASGAVMIVLKPLRAAMRDKDRIYAVVRGSAINNDGSQKVNIAAPSEKGQIAVIAAAQAAAGVQPGDIGYVETHGTGTRLGDPIEFRALAAAFGETQARGGCALSSLKSQMGHLGAAAGAAGVARAALCLYHGVKPATLHPTPLNEQIKLENTSFVLLDRAMRWTAEPRIAGVSSFGIGGANAHAVIASPPPTDRRPDLPAWDEKVIAFERRTFEVGKARSSQEEPRDPDGWFHEPSWVPVGRREGIGEGGAGQGTIALTGGNEAALAALAQAFDRAGRKFAMAKDETALRDLLGDGAVNAVVYCPRSDLPFDSYDGLRAASDELIEGPIRIVKTWNAVKGSEPLRLLIVTDDFEQSPGPALALGAQAVLPVEHRHVRACIVAMGGGADDILDVLERPPGVYAVREGVLHSRQLVAVAGPRPSRPGGIEPGDVVVITGGLGGIGRQLADAILEVPGTHVVLLGRTAGSGEIDPAARLTELRCDVTDKADVANAVRAIRYNFGRIHGVVHAAGLPGSGLVDFNGPEDRLAVLAPKVLGAVALREALRSDPPRFVLHCSSLSAFFGIPGQVDYSAANAFLDAFAASMAQEAGSAVVSVAWPSWKGTGMAASVGQRGQAVPDGLQISPFEGRGAFLKALSMGRPRLVVSPLRPETLAAELRRAGPRPTAEPELQRPLPKTGNLKSLVRSAFLAALDQDEIDDSLSFFDQGGDSWSAMLLLNAVEGRVGVSLGMSELVAHPSVEALARRVSQIRSGPAEPRGVAETIVPMKPGEGPPVIFFHPVGGELIGYREVIAAIENREVLGIRSVEALDETLEAQASAYRRELPRGGPATLVGWSYGALLAWEAARQIEAEGGRVDRLILIDPPLPRTNEQDRPPQDFEQIALRELDPGEAVAALPINATLASSPEARSVLEACKTNTKRLLAYRPAGQVRCRAVIAVATERPASWGTAQAVLEAWQDHLADIETCVPLPGGHYDCVRGQNAELIARLLQDK